MAAKFDPPARFSFKASEWEDWLEDFQRFRRATKLHQEDGDIQRDSLIYAMGSREAVKILKSIKFDNEAIPPETDTDFNCLVKKFTEYFVPKRNTIHDRSIFNSRTQSSSESVEEFIRALQALSLNCDYQDPDDQIRDRLVIGLRDQRVKEKLQLTPNLTLDRAVEIARQQELIKQQMQEQNKAASGEIDLNETYVRHRGRGRGRDHREKIPQRRKNSRNQRDEFPVVGREKNMCTRCGYVHSDKPCPAKGQKCRKCQRKNHFSRCCYMNKAGSLQELETNTYWLDSTSIGNTEAWTVDLDVCGDGYMTVFKIDTGADVTVMKESEYKKLPHRPQLHPSSITFLNSPGGRVKTLGEFTAQTKHNGQEYTFPILVVPQSAGSNLLSRAACESMGIVKRLNEVNDDDVYGSTGLLKTLPVKLVLRDGATPYCVTTARRVPFPIRDKVKRELNRMEKNGIIEKVTIPTDWCAPLVPVKKKNGNIRICIDYKKLNKSVKRPHLMVPNLDDIAPKLAGSKVFTTLDVSGGYHQIPLDEGSKLVTTFITPFGRYCMRRLAMGINVGTDEFQRKMEETLGHMAGCEIIIDDILVHGATLEEHDQRLSRVMNAIKRSGLKLNRDKCHLRQEKVTFFGHIINEHGIQPDPKKIEAVTKLSVPKNVSELRRVLGMINYLGRFTQGLSTILKPMTDLLQKNTHWQWGPHQNEAFKVVKEKLTSLPSLAYYRADRKTTVSADASSYGLGAALLQTDENGQQHPVAFASRTLTAAEQRYGQIEKECLASVWACERFERYLVGLDSFELLTDHKPLVPLFQTKDLDQCPPRCQRMLIRMMRFNADVHHVPGKQLIIADTLSRSPLEHEETDNADADEIETYVNLIESSRPISDTRLQSLREATAKDKDLQLVMIYNKEGWPDHVPATFNGYKIHQSELSESDGLLIYQNRVVVPQSQRKDILQKLHESHQGLTKCRENARQTVWWPGISRDLSRMVETCLTCQQNRSSQQYEPLKPTELPRRPWEKLGSDIFKYKGNEFLVTVDYYSRWIEVKHLSSMTSATLIRKFKQVFADHGIPELLVSDNGPQFASHEFAEFAKDYGFRHHTSSPYFPQANGEAERAVQTVKKMMQQTDPDIAMLNYRTTPHSATGISPSVALMGRQLRTKIPVMPQNLKPVRVNDREIRGNDEAAKQQYKNNFDRRHSARPLPELHPGTSVTIKTDNEKRWDIKGKIIGPADDGGRSYHIRTPHGKMRRNRKHIQKVKLTESDQDVFIPDEPEPMPAMSTKANPRPAAPFLTPSATPSPTSSPPSTPVLRRSERNRKKPVRFEDENF